MICAKCGSIGDTTKTTPGSIWIELILWLCLLIPGLIYSFWRISKRHEACGKCGSPDVIPIESPVGRKIAAETNQQSADAPLISRDLSRSIGAGRAIGKMVAKVIK